MDRKQDAIRGGRTPSCRNAVLEILLYHQEQQQLALPLAVDIANARSSYVDLPSIGCC